MKIKEFNKDEFLKLSTTYGTVEVALKLNGFNILHLMRDVRGDWADDGGFIISVSEKNSLYYLHIVEVNYNMDIRCQLLVERDEPLGHDEYHDFVSFKDLTELKIYLANMIRIINQYPKLEDCSIFKEDLLEEKTRSYIEDDYPGLLQKIENEGDQFINLFLIIAWPYAEYMEQNNKLIEDLFNTTYKPNHVYYGDDENDTSYVKDDYDPAGEDNDYIISVK